MNVSVAWLRALAPGLGGDSQELADRLSLRAVAVDAVEPVGEGLDAVRVARVLEVRAHPNADRLTLCRVDAGDGEPVQVVCGAPNVESGSLYPWIPPGATLPGGLRIESRTIRGQPSHGMLCSERELGLGRDAAGILRLSDELRPGLPLTEALGLPDARLVLDLTPNRVDLACHVGVARELAPGGVAGVRLPSFGGDGWSPRWVEDERRAAAGITVGTDDAERCLRFLSAVVRGVTVGPSPEWLASRLRAVGVRPIHNVVDATNYVMLELNHPTHAYDLARLAGPELRARAGRSGERLHTLDGVEREVDARHTVIADAEGPVGLAGVMGGERTEVRPDTTDVVIECALFDPRHTRRTARAAGLGTEASYRFERGVDASGLEAAITRCVELVLAVAGGRAEPEAVRVGVAAPERREVLLRPARVARLLGLHAEVAELRNLLVPLGFEVGGEADGREEGALRVLVPGWRGDVSREVDLLEEVARRHGYENFPDETRPLRPTSVPTDPSWLQARRVREVMVGLGFLEASTAGFVPGELAGERGIPLLRPLSAAEGWLRSDVVPGLLRRLEHNFSRSHRDVRLFEIGTAFARRPEGVGPGDHPFAEELRVGAVLTGARAEPHWSEEVPDLDVWDLKGVVELLGERLGVGEVVPERGPDPGDPVPIGASAWMTSERFGLVCGERVVGAAGRVRPEALDAPPWAAPVWAFEFRLAGVALGDVPVYRPLPAYPAVSRDLALVLPLGVRAAEVEAAIGVAAPDYLESVRPFDEYRGPGIGEGRRSLAWHLVFRAPDRTLRDEEVEAAVAAIIRTLETRFDARVRSS